MIRKKRNRQNQLTNKTTEIVPNRVPLSIITGFLGAGKTTLINHLVTQPGMSDTALIINEFGEIGLDNILVETSIENTLVLENGCICCSIRGDLIDTINDLFAKAENNQIPQFSRILIETTGLADPAPIIKTIQNEVTVINRCTLNNVTTIVDGLQGSPQITQHEEAVLQIVQADLALISKTDLATPEEIEKITGDIHAINPTLIVKGIQHGRIEPDFLFQASAKQASQQAENLHNNDFARESGHDHEERHGNVATWSLVHDEPLDEERLRDWLRMIFTLRSFDMLRLKGFVRLENAERPILIQAVGNIFSPPVWLESWPGGEPQTQLVMIFKELSPDIVKKSFHRHVLGQK